jgi:hypothetical protein
MDPGRSEEPQRAERVSGQTIIKWVSCGVVSRWQTVRHLIDGLSRQSAEREARSLTALWVKIAVHHPKGTSAPAVHPSASVSLLHTDLNPEAVGDSQIKSKLKVV